MSHADPLVVVDCGEFRIRHKRLHDAIDDYAWRRDPETARFDGNAPITLTYSQFYAQFERDILFRPDGHCSYALESPDGVHFGNLVYYNVAAARSSVEFGMTIGLPAYRDRGLGTVAAIAFLRHLWETTPFRLIYLHTLEWNERAVRAFRRAGFEDAERVCRNGQWFLRMEARREWWLMWDMEGRFRSRSRPTGESRAALPPRHAAVTE